MTELPIYFEADVQRNGRCGRRFFVTLSIGRKYVQLLVVATCQRTTMKRDEFEQLPKVVCHIVKKRLLAQLRENARVYNVESRRDHGRAVKQAIRVIKSIRRDQ